MGGAIAFTLGGHWAERMTPTLAGVGSSHWKAGKGCASRWHPRNLSGWIHWGEWERCVPLHATVHHKVIPPPGLSLGFSCLPTSTTLEISICVFSFCLLRSSQASREGLVGGVPEKAGVFSIASSPGRRGAHTFPETGDVAVGPVTLPRSSIMPSLCHCQELTRLSQGPDC